ncbi:MAG: hypothetical protein A2046_02835 [Bacteroidetes bacterium GWA2_30_7]|nr:MAG: hypothetical protein A2046_02835 [Bacteroidetes bacterium GWA2_30_7]
MEENNKNIEILNLLDKYFVGECADIEIKTIHQWVNSKPENKSIYNEYYQLWMISESNKIDENIENEWKNIESKVFDKLENETKIIPLNTEKGSYKIFFRLAASITLIIAISALAYYFSGNKYQEVIATNTVIESMLPDGSQVSLNANSKIQYPEKFEKNTRKVKLEGEAFFDVSHDKTKPFIIEAGDVSIEVLGTSFYVKTNTECNKTEVIVKTGRVAVYETKNKESKVILEPGQKTEFSVTESSHQIIENNDVNFLSWKTMNLSFDNSPLSKVIDDINKTFHSDLKVTNPDVNNCLITVSFENQNLESVIKILKSTLNLEVKKTKNTIEISGKGCN